MRAQITIYAPSAEKAEVELKALAEECGATPRVLSILPQGGHNWLVSYNASEDTVQRIEEWVS